MKYLLLLALALVVLWVLRQAGQRRRGPPGEAAKPDAAARPATPAEPAPMVECVRCGLVLPRSEAVTGRGGAGYCCEAHRAEAERG